MSNKINSIEYQYKMVSDALERLFTNTDVLVSVTIEKLEQLQDDIKMMIENLKATSGDK